MDSPPPYKCNLVQGQHNKAQGPFRSSGSSYQTNQTVSASSGCFGNDVFFNIGPVQCMVWNSHCLVLSYNTAQGL